MAAVPAVQPRVKPNLTQIQAELCRRDLRRFVRDSWHTIEPRPLIWNWHLDAICDFLTYVTLGDISFGLINVPPRTSKSTICSVIWPAWEWTGDHTLKHLTASYAFDLAKRDAVRTRLLVQSDWYRERYPSIVMAGGQDRQDRFKLKGGGERIAISVGGRTTGEGGDRQVLDDPHNAQDVESDVMRASTLDWFDNSWFNRSTIGTQPTRLIIGQRTHELDLFGHVFKLLDKGEYHHLNLPNEFESKQRSRVFVKGAEVCQDPRVKEGELLFPQSLSAKVTASMKSVMAPGKYSLQYQQRVADDDGAILPRSAWKPWGDPDPVTGAIVERDWPELLTIFTVYDTAFEEDEEADYSARTTWGIFEGRDKVKDPESGIVTLGPVKRRAIILDRWKGQVAFHELKQRAIAHYKDREPDYVLVEKKASGHSFIQELRRAGIPARGVSIRGGKKELSKIARAQAASPVLTEGAIFYPVGREWAEEVITDCALFPKGGCYDIVDTCTMAWLFLRRFNELQLDGDQDDETLVLDGSAPEPGSFYG